MPDGTLGADFRVGAVRTFWFEGENGDGFRLDEEVRFFLFLEGEIFTDWSS